MKNKGRSALPDEKQGPFHRGSMKNSLRNENLETAEWGEQFNGFHGNGL
jgi:hypothetical protein